MKWHAAKAKELPDQAGRELKLGQRREQERKAVEENGNS